MDGQTITIIPFAPVLNGESLGMFPYVETDSDIIPINRDAFLYAFNHFYETRRLLLANTLNAANAMARLSGKENTEKVAFAQIMIPTIQKAIDAAVTSKTNGQNTLTNVSQDDIDTSSGQSVNTVPHLNPSEKATVLELFNAFKSEMYDNTKNADSFGVQKSEYENAYNALKTYLAPLMYDPLPQASQIELYGQAKFQYHYDDGSITFVEWIPLKDTNGNEIEALRIPRPAWIWPSYNAVIEYGRLEWPDTIRNANKNKAARNAGYGDEFMHAILKAVKG